MLNESNLKDKRVIIRADFNVPIIDGEITDNHRILKIIPTIKHHKSSILVSIFIILIHL